MALSLRVFTFVLITVYFIVIFKLLKRKKFALKYSLLWLFAGIVMLIVAIWPEILIWLAGLLGVKVASNGFFAICIFLIVVILISLTAVISDFSVRIKGIIQNIALLEERVRVLETQIGKFENKDN